MRVLARIHTGILLFAILFQPAAGFAKRIARHFNQPSSSSSRTTMKSTATTTTIRLFAKSRKNAGSFNPITSFMGDMASSFINSSSYGSGNNNKELRMAQSNVNRAIASLSSSSSPTSSSWQDIRNLLESMMQTDDERNFRNNLAKGYGVASPLHKIRLFDESNQEQDIRVTFYRDSASWCPYCQKVWMTLEEKKIPYRVEKVNMRCYGDKPADFLRLQPSGQIPVAIIDGKTYGQSNDILHALEENFPYHKSLRPPAGQEQNADILLRLERQIFSAWMYWLTMGGDSNRQRFVETLDQVEQALAQTASGGPFFLGDTVTLVDFMYAPFLERMAASLLYYKGFQMRFPPKTPNDYPALNRWFDAMETLDSYQLTKSDYYTHCWDLPPQLGGCAAEKGGEKYAQAIDGERTLDGSRGSWELPLQPHNGGVEPDWAWAGGDDEHAARREAVERVSANHGAIVRFAARGAGRKGMPPVSAPLADPNATPNEAVIDTVDAFLRTICLAMLEGTEKHESHLSELIKVVKEEGGDAFVNAVVDSLSYMRDRVGVPRDMKLPAARQLRAHANWAIGKLLDG